MKHIFIVNPAAGKKGSTEKLVAHLQRVCPAAGLDYTVITTEYKGHDTEIARSYAEQGEPVRLYACGGDGTLNGIVQGAAGYDHVAVTNVPKGTGNDFLKMFGPENRNRFNDIVALSKGPQAAFDLIDCNGVLGLDIVCAGVDARIARDVHSYSALPLVTGKGAYVGSLMSNIMFKGISRTMKVSMGDRSWDEPISILCICNGRYYGGGFMPVGEAQPDDGILDVLLVRHVTRRKFIALVGDYSKGLYRKYPDVILEHHGPGPITFSSDEVITLCVDGEIVEGKEFTAQVSDKKVNFFYPEDVDWRQPGTTAKKKPSYVAEER